jgi:hypothetical protein
MQVLDVGEPITIRMNWWDNNGAPADPASINLTIYLPDGTVNIVDQLAMTREAVGVWSYIATATLAGVWRFHALGSLFNDIVVQDSAVLVGVGEQAGSCENWCGWDDVVTCAPITAPNEAQREQWIEQATEILYDLSGRYYPGICTVTRSLCFACWHCWPQICTCDPWPGIDLGGRFPALGAWDVILDGVLLDPTAYTLRGRRWLVRLDGQGWPSGWHTVDPDTFRVTWATGRNPPVGGQRAAAVLAGEIAKRCLGDASCKLPNRITNVVREGVTFTMIDSLKMLEDGRTGLPDVDQWLIADKIGRKRHPGMFHPAAVSQRRYA